MENTHNRAFCRGIAPWFIVTGEDTEMTATNKLFVIETKDGVVRVQEVGMEHYLYAIIVVIEELDPADLVENRIGMVFRHIVGGDWRKRVPFQSQDTTLQKDIVFFCQELVWTRQCTIFSVCKHEISYRQMRVRIHEPIGTDGVIEKPSTDSILDLCDCVSELFRDSLALQGIDGI